MTLSQDLRTLVSALETSPVSPTCLVVLAAVVEAPGKRPTDYLSSSLQWLSKADLSVYLKRLEDAGLVGRTANPFDKRSFLYVPSQAGKEALQGFVAAVQGVGQGSEQKEAPEAI